MAAAVSGAGDSRVRYGGTGSGSSVLFPVTPSDASEESTFVASPPPQEHASEDTTDERIAENCPLATLQKRFEEEELIFNRNIKNLRKELSKEKKLPGLLGISQNKRRFDAISRVAIEYIKRQQKRSRECTPRVCREIAGTLNTFSEGSFWLVVFSDALMLRDRTYEFYLPVATGFSIGQFLCASGASLTKLRALADEGGIRKALEIEREARQLSEEAGAFLTQSDIDSLEYSRQPIEVTGEEDAAHPNIGITPDDWLQAISNAKKSVEVIVTFVAQQTQSLTAGLIDFHQAIEFFKEQLKIVREAKALAESEQKAQLTCCGIDCNTALTWLSRGAISVASGASALLNTAFVAVRGSDPFDATKVGLTLGLTAVAGCSRYVDMRISVGRKELKKRELQLEEVIKFGKHAQKLIELHLRGFKRFDASAFPDGLLSPGAAAAPAAASAGAAAAATGHAVASIEFLSLEKEKELKGMGAPDAVKWMIGEVDRYKGDKKEEYIRNLVRACIDKDIVRAGNFTPLSNPIVKQLFLAAFSKE